MIYTIGKVIFMVQKYCGYIHIRGRKFKLLWKKQIVVSAAWRLCNNSFSLFFLGFASESTNKQNYVVHLSYNIIWWHFIPVTVLYSCEYSGTSLI